MSLVQVLFYFFAAMTVASAFMVITQNNPVRCVLFLVFTFINSAAIWLLAEAEFLALILILVYVGAVMTLFLFVVMMLDINVESVKSHLKRYLPFGLILVALLVSLLMISIPKGTFTTNLEQQNTVSLASQASANINALSINGSNTEALGLVLYTDYFLVFELAAVLLLVAIVSAITLAHQGARNSKRQDVKQQLMVTKEERLSLLSMKAEK